MDIVGQQGKIGEPKQYVGGPPENQAQPSNGHLANGSAPGSADHSSLRVLNVILIFAPCQKVLPNYLANSWQDTSSGLVHRCQKAQFCQKSTSNDNPICCVVHYEQLSNKLIPCTKECMQSTHNLFCRPQGGNTANGNGNMHNGSSGGGSMYGGYQSSGYGQPANNQATNSNAGGYGGGGYGRPAYGQPPAQAQPNNRGDLFRTNRNDSIITFSSSVM